MILKQRLKVPPPIHQFSKTLDKNLGKFRFLFTAVYVLAQSDLLFACLFGRLRNIFEVDFFVRIILFCDFNSSDYVSMSF